jgi:hypothetical protein
LAEPALRVLWRRFHKEGKIAADVREPSDSRELCGHPINFIVGGAKSVVQKLKELQREVAFDVANVEVRWEGLSHGLVCNSLERLMREITKV